MHFSQTGIGSGMKLSYLMVSSAVSITWLMETT